MKYKYNFDVSITEIKVREPGFDVTNFEETINVFMITLEITKLIYKLVSEL